MMQSEANSECIYISDESPSVPQLTVFSKSSFGISDVSSNIGASLVDEIEMEDISDEVIVPVTPSPLLNNKRQQHIAIGRGIKRTCLEKAFSTMSTPSSNCTNGVDVMQYNFLKQEGMFPENNSKSINGKDSNIRTSLTGLSKNDAPSKGKEILSFPHKHSSKNCVFNSSANGILREENSRNDVQVLGKPKFIPRKRGTVIINSDSDDSTDNVAETSFRNVHSVCEFRNSKEHRNENKMLQKNLTVTEHCSLSNKSSSESLFENYGLMKAKKFTNKYSGASLDTDSNNKGKSHICKELNSQHTGLHQNDVYPVPPNNKSLKNQLKLYKRSPKATSRDHCHEQESRYNITSFNNTKPSYFMNKTRSNSDKNSEGATNQRNCNASSVQVNTIASTSSKCENSRVRRKHSHRGQIARYPVDDSDTDLEFYDAKSDLSDRADSKRPTKGSRKKKLQRRQRFECLSSDSSSSSDVSVVSEMHFSPSSRRSAKLYVRNTESPDPVEQVRQMEEDERLAYILQAQFDAELEGNGSNEEIGGGFNSSILSSLTVDSASSSSDSSSSSSFSTAAAETVFPFLLSNSLSPRILRDLNSHTLEHTRRSARLQQRQPSIIGWMPESVQTVLTAWMPNFAEDSTYESLLEITEQIGEESRGLKKQQINGLPTRQFSVTHTLDSSASGSSSREKQDCTICLCEYQNNEVLRSLPCCHEFHANCIDRWLKSHSTCPICRIEVSLQRQFGRKRKS